MSRESNLWRWLFNANAGTSWTRPAKLDMTRIENLVGVGTPDVEGYVNVPPHNGEPGWSGQFWFELKSVERPARPSTPLRFKIRDAQIAWLNARWEVGANAFWLLQVGSGADRRLYLAPGDLGRQLRDGLTEAELAVACLNTGVFLHGVTQEEVLKRAVTCRNRFPSPRLQSRS